MALPNSGVMTAAMINLELKRAENAPFSLNDPDVRKLAGKLSGAISFQDFYGKSSEIVVTLAAGAKGVVGKSLFSPADWTGDTVKKIIVPNGVEVGPEWGYAFATSVSADGQAGSFGGELILEVQAGGILSGSGGAANGGWGGNAVFCNLPGKNGQKLQIINNGIIRAGGGGGGNGGNGGNGSYPEYIREPASGDEFVTRTSQYGAYNERSYAGGGDYNLTTSQIISFRGVDIWNRRSQLPGSPYQHHDGWAYHRANSRQVNMPNGWSGTYTTYGIVRDRTNWHSSWGGAGGNGGVGQGYGQSASNGAGGAPGGPNAGAGGKGGNGGGWGQPGGAGASGSNGNSSSGLGGGAGGQPGMAITDPANYSISGNGQLLGRL